MNPKTELDIVAMDMEHSEHSFYALLAEILDDQNWLKDMLNESSNVQPVGDQRSNLISRISTADDPEKTIVADGSMPQRTADDNFNIMTLHHSVDEQPGITDLEETIFVSSEFVSGMLSHNGKSSSSNASGSE